KEPSDSLDFFDLRVQDKYACIIELMLRNNLYKGLTLNPESVLTEEGLKNIRSYFSLQEEKTTHNDLVTGDPLVSSYFSLLEEFFPPYYKRPKREVYLEKFFSFSSRDHQMLKSGASSWKVSTNIGVSSGWVNVGGGGNYGNQNQTASANANSGKTVYLLVRQVIPKIELYFPAKALKITKDFKNAITQILEDCLVDGHSLEEYVTKKIELPSKWQTSRSVHVCYGKLLLLLSQFGFYYINECTLGGVLYSEDVQELSDIRAANQALHSMAWGVSGQAGIGPVDVSASSAKSNSSAQNEATQTANQTRQISISAIGGNPSYVYRPDEWAAQLANWKTWSIIKYSYVPIINLLSSDQAEMCLKLLQVFILQPLFNGTTSASPDLGEKVLIDLDKRVRAAIDLSIYCHTIEEELTKLEFSVFPFAASSAPPSPGKETPPLPTKHISN
ncbi:MAG TPA: MAC/perforin domain-containing protein, partial [Cytophagaceae bacterium]